MSVKFDTHITSGSIFVTRSRFKTLSDKCLCFNFEEGYAISIRSLVANVIDSTVND